MNVLFLKLKLKRIGSNNINAGRPIRVPVVPSQRAATVQQKRQVDYDPSSVRPNSAATARQQTPSGVPLQQPFRQPQSQANFRRPQAEKPQQVAEQNNQNSQRPNGNLASFVPPTSSEQLFTSLRDSSETPARQVQRPNRPAAANVERPARNPEFNSGFPSGFTSGLPSFDFQGRMPGKIKENFGHSILLHNCTRVYTIIIILQIVRTRW